MSKENNLRLKLAIEKCKEWFREHHIQLGIFNAILMLMILLRSAGYFEPYVAISINMIFIVALVFAAFLLSMRSAGAASVALVFWILTLILRLLNIDFWAERTALYVFESLSFFIFLLMVEYVSGKRV